MHYGAVNFANSTMLKLGPQGDFKRAMDGIEALAYVITAYLAKAIREPWWFGAIVRFNSPKMAKPPTS